MHQAELQHETFELDLSTTPDVAFTCIVEARLGDELSTQHCPTPLRRGVYKLTIPSLIDSNISTTLL